MVIPSVLLLAVVLVAVAVRLRGGRISAPLPPASPDEVLRLLSAGQTVESIKMHRRLTGLGLYEAKQAIDRMRDTGVWEGPAAAPLSPEPGAEVTALVKEGDMIGAIKLYRETHGVDLLTAKNAVEKLSRG